MALTFLDLCAGIGGISLGLTRAGMTCVGQVEIDEYCNKILRRHWPDVPRWRDITILDPAELPRAMLIAGGYPCQPFSLAGKRQGAGDNRHLWPFIARIVTHHRPAWCLFENVAGHVSLGLDAVCSDLEGLGYACGPLVVPACAVDAPHRRDRVWILAHAGRQGQTLSRRGGASVADSEGFSLRAGAGQRWRRSGGGGRPGISPHADGLAGSEKFHAAATANKERQSGRIFAPEWRAWPVEPGVGRVAHGVPGRVDRLKGLGNAVVPQIAEIFGLAIVAAHERDSDAVGQACAVG